ncbi:neutral protease 2 [Colletotrichum higginsianum]|nr:neutral protease 2 [Colletotrichum higginsianum]
MSAWRTRRTYSPSAGLSLLHEMTHLKDVVGGFGDWPPKYGRSVDVTYAPSNSKKIANAQNYMLFALEVKANLENASKKVAAGCQTNGKMLHVC